MSFDGPQKEHVSKSVQPVFFFHGLCILRNPCPASIHEEGLCVCSPCPKDHHLVACAEEDLVVNQSTCNILPISHVQGNNSHGFSTWVLLLEVVLTQSWWLQKLGLATCVLFLATSRNRGLCCKISVCISGGGLRSFFTRSRDENTVKVLEANSPIRVLDVIHTFNMHVLEKLPQKRSLKENLKGSNLVAADWVCQPFVTYVTGNFQMPVGCHLA